MARSRRKNQSSVGSSRQLITDMNIDSSLKFKVEEAYKSIRTNIMFSVMKKGCKTIVVTSSVPNEGKTTTTTNIAIALSQANQKVLLIDGDLRKPKIHQYFTIPNAPGLTDYLGSRVGNTNTANADLFTVIHPTEFENLSVLCSGSIPPNPAEILGSEPMAEFLKEISADFDYIVIDTPPINIVSDSLPIIREADGVVLVVRSNQSTHPEIQRAISALEFIDAKILGFVINSVEASHSRYGYGKYGKYRYGRYYGYYGGYRAYSQYGGYYGSYGGYDNYSQNRSTPMGGYDQYGNNAYNQYQSRNN